MNDRLRDEALAAKTAYFIDAEISREEYCRIMDRIEARMAKRPRTYRRSVEWLRRKYLGARRGQAVSAAPPPQQERTE